MATPFPRRPVTVLLTVAAAAVPAAAHAQPARPPATSAFTGVYDLRLMAPDDEPVSFRVLVVDSAGRLGGRWVTARGRVRPLGGVTARPDSGAIVIQYADGAGPVTMRLAVKGDSVRGTSVYADGAFPVVGRRRARVAADSALFFPAP